MVVYFVVGGFKNEVTSHILCRKQCRSKTFYLVKEYLLFSSITVIIDIG